VFILVTPPIFFDDKIALKQQKTHSKRGIRFLLKLAEPETKKVPSAGNSRKWHFVTMKTLVV